MRIGCVVVTYNRKQLLIECLEAIYRQTVPVERLILIDNASTDGTKEELEIRGFMTKPGFKYCRMETNLGGSGGFYEGLKRANSEFDWVWIMDDDTIPNPDCLEKLLCAADKKQKKVSFLASSVFGPENEPMNIPSVDFRLTKNGYPDWYFDLKDRLVKIQSATFVSLLISSEALKRCGLPCKEYFIWGDDTEYTTRLTTFYGPAYMVGNSIVCHKRVGAKALSILNENDPKRIENYFYYYRNLLVNTYVYKGKKAGFEFALRCLIFAVKILRKEQGWRKCKTVLKAVHKGTRQWSQFDMYIKGQINGAD